LDVSKRPELIAQAIKPGSTDSSLLLLIDISLPDQFKDIIKLIL
jgi:hypothetical protein